MKRNYTFIPLLLLLIVAIVACSNNSSKSDFIHYLHLVNYYAYI